MNFPSKILEKAVEEISGLPGIGKKSALRLALHLLKQPKSNGISLSEAIKSLISEINYCKKCHNISDLDICEICQNKERNQSLICIVEDVRDVMAIENTGKFKGNYFVLGGKISPMEGITPQHLNIESLENRLEKNPSIKEIIFALSATMEGETTTYYLYKKLKKLSHISFTNIARGISVGDELEYADEISLGQSIINRIPYKES